MHLERCSSCLVYKIFSFLSMDLLFISNALSLYCVLKNAGENLQGKIYWPGVCHEKAQEIRDAPKRTGTADQ